MRFEEARAPAGAPRRSYSRGIVLAGLAFTGDLFFWHLSILNTTVANATFFATTAPVFVILVSWLVLRQRIASATVAGLLFCLLGGGALIGQSLQVDPARIRGDLYGIATALFFGLYFLAVGRAREAALAAMALISHAGGQGLLAVALGRLPPIFSSLVIFLEAVAAAVFGWLILNEALTLVQALGGALILAGIWVARPRRAAPVG
jgi:drug/metabolite transporter (DMT)-like permease